ncbi:MAG: hypothetical protein ACOC93_02055, partial [Planctomycetota bacterium]
DLYMQGTTDAQNRVRYEIGLLLVSDDPEWNHKYQQARLPLLTVRGRIVEGKLVDQVVGSALMD